MIIYTHMPSTRMGVKVGQREGAWGGRENRNRRGGDRHERRGTMSTCLSEMPLRTEWWSRHSTWGVQLESV